MKQFKRDWLRLQGFLLSAVISLLFQMSAKPADISGEGCTEKKPDLPCKRLLGESPSA